LTGLAIPLPATEIILDLWEFQGIQNPSHLNERQIVFAISGPTQGDAHDHAKKPKKRMNRKYGQQMVDGCLIGGTLSRVAATRDRWGAI
jgi:hypothetical protein